MEEEITTNATEYVFTKTRTCENCEFWVKTGYIHGWGGCQKLPEVDYLISFADITNKNIEIDVIDTHKDFGCNQYQESEVEGE